MNIYQIVEEMGTQRGTFPELQNDLSDTPGI